MFSLAVMGLYVTDVVLLLRFSQIMSQLGGTSCRHKLVNYNEAAWLLPKRRRVEDELTWVVGT